MPPPLWRDVDEASTRIRLGDPCSSLRPQSSSRDLRGEGARRAVQVRFRLQFDPTSTTTTFSTSSSLSQPLSPSRRSENQRKKNTLQSTKQRLRLLLFQRVGLCPRGPEGLRLLEDDRQGRRALRLGRRSGPLGPHRGRELLVRRRRLLRVGVSLRAHPGEAAEGEGGADEPPGSGTAADRGGGFPASACSEVTRKKKAGELPCSSGRLVCLHFCFLKPLVNWQMRGRDKYSTRLEVEGGGGGGGGKRSGFWLSYKGFFLFFLSRV